MVFRKFIAFFVFAVLASELVVASFKNVDPLIQSECANGAKRRRSLIEEDRKSWDTVPFKREDLIGYMKLGFDTDDDKALSYQECENARNYYLNDFERQIVETCETIFLKCDCDQDGYITQEDFANSYMTCLKDAKSGKIIYYFVGSRITAGGAFAGKKNSTYELDVPVDQLSK